MGETKVSVKIGDRYKPVTVRSYDTLGCAIVPYVSLGSGKSYTVNPSTGQLAIKYNKDKFERRPKIKMIYKYPCKEDPQSILELDAYTWTMENEEKLEKDD